MIPTTRDSTTAAEAAPREARVPEALRRLTIAAAEAPDSALLAVIQEDLRGATTVLELFRRYMQELEGSADNQADAFRKMELLFRLGQVPASMDGHYYGVALGLRTTGEVGPLSHMTNVVGLLWGAALADQSPWVGKSFLPINDARLEAITGGAEASRPARLGINHFNHIHLDPMNTIAFHACRAWLELEPATREERDEYGYEQKGGHFIACKARSVWERSPREVIQLNYRWAALHNRPPLSWLIDELVEVAEGLYLGQLLFATKHLVSDHDPARPPSESDYVHMGYFLLFDERWNPEARRLFAFLEIPVTAPGMLPRGQGAARRGRFATLKQEEPPPPACDDRVFAEVLRDLEGQPTVLHLLKAYADALQDNLDNASPCFLRLQELFNRGAPVKEMRGFYRGALVTWHGEGLFDLFGANVLNFVWRTVAGRLSTWTGKAFEDVGLERLKEFTDGYETGAVPTFWGANTQALRTLKERQVGRLMRLANIWCEPVTGAEALANGYDLKNFFFIAREAGSLNERCRGKRVFQFNYRWPRLRTMIPDCYCIDELVEIADGLFLGQLMYATELTKPYDPRVPPAEYRYGMFGYFLLMTPEWHRIRMEIGFDLENT